MRIVIATSQPLFERGADDPAEDLRDALQEEGHEVDTLAFPAPPRGAGVVADHLLAARLLDLSGSADLVIGLRFPAYCVRHPNKVLWLVGPGGPAPGARGADDGPDDTPEGSLVREAVRFAERASLPQARAVFTRSAEQSQDLGEQHGLRPPPLYHPPRDAAAYQSCEVDEAEPYLLALAGPGDTRRTDLLLEALALTRAPVCLRLEGAPARNAAPHQALGDRVAWEGPLRGRKRRDLIARSRGVVWVAAGPGYGGPVLEAMLSGKPVLADDTAPGVADFLRHEETGLVVGSGPGAVAEALDRLWQAPALARSLGEAGRAAYAGLGISWPGVARRLVG